MTRDLTEKNLVEEAEVFADISNVNLYDGRNVIQPEDLELLPQEMYYKDSEGKPAKVMADVRSDGEKRFRYRDDSDRKSVGDQQHYADPGSGVYFQQL